MTQDLQTTFGKNLTAFREAEGESREVFAGRLDLEEERLWTIEAGSTEVSLEEVEAIALRLSIEAILLLESAGR